MHETTRRLRGRVWRVVRTAVHLGALLVAPPVCAQELPPRIGPFVLDFHGVVPKFGDDPQLATSRALSQAELPGPTLGVSAALHFYFPKIRGVTVGIGGEAVIGRSSTAPEMATPATGTPATGTPATATIRPVTETFKEISPQLSLNFGNGNGWSYLSAGIGQAIWSIVPEGRAPFPVDEEVIRVLNYGGGARWFAKKRLAFSLDVRLYEIPAGTPQLAGLIAPPRTLLLVIGAGISLR